MTRNLDQVSRTLEELSSSGLGRLYTIKALVELGKGWHTTREVASFVYKTYHYGTNHVFELGRKFPSAVELDKQNDLVRIPDSVFKDYSKKIDSYLRNAFGGNVRRKMSS